MRYLVDVLVSARVRSEFPLGTLVANAAGCLLLGLVSGTALAADSPAVVLVGTGVAGALSTFSTFSFEAVRLVEEERVWLSVCYVVASVVIGSAGIALGLAAGG